MVNVTESYKRLATAGGRSVFCRVEAGDSAFTDDDIIGFEFDDVVYPEALSFGNTCACRFHITLKTDAEIPLSAVIKPYISFEEGGEECPLGIFYISRRSRRNGVYEITCYDRMYNLGEEYSTELAFPCGLNKVFEELCEKNGITADFMPAAYVVEGVPSAATVRDIIGYAAGTCGGSAKFSRSGKLTLIKSRTVSAEITRENYAELSVGAEVYRVSAVEMQTESGTYSVGDGTGSTTYRQYNPFGTKAMNIAIGNFWIGFQYRGLEAETQGLPYLEAGDVVTVQAESGDEVYTAVISEHRLTYDGGLYGTIISRSKTPADETVSKSASEKELENLKNTLMTSVYTYTNESYIGCGTVKVLLFEMKFEVSAPTVALLGAMLTMNATEDLSVELSFSLNGAAVNQRANAFIPSGKSAAIPLHCYFDSLRLGENVLKVYGETDTGTAASMPYQTAATIWGHCLGSGIGGSRSPVFYFEDKLNAPTIPARGITVKAEESLDMSTESEQ